MAVKRVRNHGQWRWRARVHVHGQRKVGYYATKDEARQAEGAFYRDLKHQAEGEQRADAAPATVKQHCELYVFDLERRGKAKDSIDRASTTAKAIAAHAPALLARPVSQVTARDLYDFRQARLRAGAKPSTLNRDLRTIRGMLKQARPDFKVPGAVFLPEDETRVRWLAPTDELLVLESLRSPVREIARLAALTLMRLSEIRLLRRDDVHLDQGVILLPRAKAGARPVILSGDAQKILHGQLAVHESEWVFPNPHGRPYDRS